MKALALLFLSVAVMVGCSTDDPSKAKEKPVAQFAFEVLEKGQVKFTNTSLHGEEHEWQFGDGASSTDKEPTHTYAKNGKYTVTLTVKNPKGSNSLSSDLEIADLYPPVASFTFENKGKGMVVFTSTSTHAKEYEWDFGNGKSSRVPNPTHTYEDNGTYQVRLMVKNEYGSDATSQTLELANVLLPLANFTFTVDQGKVVFTNTSQHATSYVWDFGDGNSSTDPSPTHTYTENKNYAVALTAKSDIGENRITKTVSISDIPVIPQTANQTIFATNFVGNQPFVQAYDASSGQLKWSKGGFDGRIHGAIAVVNGSLYFLTTHRLYALDALSGNVRWSFPAGSEGSPVVLNNVVYFGSSDGKIYAVNASNGSKKWERSVAGAISASVIVQDQLLYVGTHAPSGGGGGTFYAVNVGDGSINWQRGTYGGSINTKAQVYGSYVYFGGSVGLHVLNRHNGSGHEGLVAYSFRQVQHSSPVVSDHHVFAVFGGSDILRVDVGSDAALWNHSLQSSNNNASPVLIENTVFISGQNRVYALNKGNGSVLWSFGGTHFNSQNITFANDLIYVADRKGNNSELLALNAGNGSVVFRTTVTGAVGDLSVLAKDGKGAYPGSTGQQ